MLEERCRLLLRLICVQSQQEGRTSSYGMNVSFTLGYEMMQQPAIRLHLHKLDDCAPYAELLPARYQLTRGEFLTPNGSSFDNVPLISVSPQLDDHNKQSIPDAAAACQRPINFNPVLTKLANSGLCNGPIDMLCQVHWSSPTSRAWQDLEEVAAQVAAVIHWMKSSAQLAKTVGPTPPAGRTPQQQHQRLLELLFWVLHDLLVGHVLDMTLNMTKMMRLLFDNVVAGWSESFQSSGDSPVSRLGRAFLRRIAVDGALASTLFVESEERPWGDGLVATCFTLMGQRFYIVPLCSADAFCRLLKAYVTCNLLLTC